MADEFPSLIVIAGATGTGKSALAVKLAKLFGGEIISCDSTQVYRWMNIGTAKATPQEQSTIRHYGLDLVDPSQPFDVELFTRHAEAVMRSCKRPLIAVGGSGFYLKVFYECISDGVAISQKTRQHVDCLRETGGLPGLLNALDEHNGEITTAIDRKNPRRVLRALERCLETQLPLKEIHRLFSNVVCRFKNEKKVTVLLTDSGDDYSERLRTRIEYMLANGLIDETELLRKLNFEQNPSACGAIGYREVLEFIDGKIGKDCIAELIFRRTKKLVRKQRTWFNHQIPVDVTFSQQNSQDVAMVANSILSIYRQNHCRKEAFS
jgi:tRNA dimethylallyltransferase